MMKFTPLHLLSAVTLCALPASAQDRAPPATGQDPMARPTEYGIRITPRMARGISSLVAKHVFTGHYQLPEDRVEEASETLARRLMELAHAADEGARAQDLAEFALGELFGEMGRTGHDMDGLPRRMGMGIGQRILPLLPAVRAFIKNIGQDLRPMLPVKEQLKLGRDLMAAKAGLDVFEKNMELWAAGDVDAYANPFEPRDKPIELNENGESQALKRARKQAERDINREQWSEWEKYVKEAKQFYELNDAQAATADSILREMIERAEELIRDEAWRQRAYENRIWVSMLRALRMGRNSPLRDLLERRYRTVNEPIEALERELKQRIDDVPTQSQCEAAEERMMAALAEHGFDRTEEE